jgi:hypothetical protein
MLADTSNLLLKLYHGDLRKLREAAECDPARERKLLMECKGIGEVGADIFLREVQSAWNELYPFADSAALKFAGTLGLPAKTEELAELVPENDFPPLVAALVRCRLSKDSKEVMASAGDRRS